MLEVVCGGCSARYKVKPRLAGKQIKCPKCGEAMQIPAAPEAEPAAGFPVIRPTVDEPQGTSSSVAASRSASSKNASPLPILLGGIGGVVLALGLLAVIWSVWRSPGDGDRSASNPRDNRRYEEFVSDDDYFKLPPPVRDPVSNPPTPTPTPGQPLPSIADLAEKYADAVVLITCFDEDGDEESLGSGFVIDASGLIATNYHVVEDAARATVRFHDGTVVDVAGIRACDSDGDLAIIQVARKPAKLVVFELAPDALLRQGAEVVAMGNPAGFRFTVTDGIISAVRDTKDLPGEISDELFAPEDYQWIQTTAAISGGSSGGPLLNRQGKVIGVNTWIAEGQNLGFAAHVRHLTALRGKLNQQPVALAAFNRAESQRREKVAIERFRTKLEEARKDAAALKWQPTSEDEYVDLSFLATGLWLAATKKFELQQIDRVRQSLTGIDWDWKTRVRPNNAYAVEFIDGLGRGVVFLGTIKALSNSSRNRCVMQVAGRGYDLWVTDLIRAKPPWKTGDTCVVIGARTGLGPDPQVPQKLVHHVEAAIVEKVKLEGIPADTALKQAHDYIRYGRRGTDYVRTVQGYAPNFQELEYDEKDQRTIWNKVRLNANGHQFDGLRFRTPKGDRRDFVWMCVSPPKRMGSWYIMPVKGSMRGFRNFHDKGAVRRPNVDLPDSNSAFQQMLPAADLKPDSEYILWFTFPDDQPVDVHVIIRLAPEGSVSNTSRGLEEALRLTTATVSKSQPPELPPSKPKTSPPTGVPPRFVPAPPTKSGDFNANVLTAEVQKKNRQALERTLQFGGDVGMMFHKEGRLVARTVWRSDDVPTEPFYVTKVRFLSEGDLITDLSYLSGLTQLHTLDISGRGVTDALVLRLKDLPKLVLFSVTGDGITDATMSHLKNFPTLTHVTVRGTKVTDKGVESLRALPGLAQLTLDNTEITDDATAALKTMSYLSSLNASDTAITDRGVANLVQCPALRHLILSKTSVTNDSLKLLGKMPKLETLGLSETKITGPGLAGLAETRALQYLYLNNVPLSDDALAPLGKLTTLRILSVQRTGLTSEQAAALQKDLPKCKIGGVKGYRSPGQ